MTSAYAAESNRRNAQKSSGPKSQAGKERSRWNALDHGATARLAALPGEDGDDLERQRDQWMASRTTDDPIELALLERAFETWRQLGRTLRAQQGRLALQMREADQVERQRARDAAIALADRLFRDRHGLHQTHPNRQPSGPHPPLSGHGTPGDPDEPARLVLQLESTAAGCRWLLDRWKELAQILESGDCWRSPNRFRAIRLLGKQPLDAMVDFSVRTIFLACHVISPVSKSPFDDLIREVKEDWAPPHPVILNALDVLTIKPLIPQDPAEERQILESLVDRAMTGLPALLSEHEARDDVNRAGLADHDAFDRDHQGEVTRRYEMSGDRAFHSARVQLRLFRKDARSPGCGKPGWDGETEREKGSIRHAELELAHLQRTVAEMGSDVAAAPAPMPLDVEFETASSNGPNLRNEPDAASIDRDDSATDTGNHAEPGTPDSQTPRNEPDAASIDRDELASETGNHADPGTRDGHTSRNEPVAGSSDRDDLAGRSVSSAPAVVTQWPRDRRRPCTPCVPMPLGNKRRLADCVAVRPRAPTASAPPS
jgi:hypothetical protein